uniref:Uncharacterized protein n=1 Tax=Avena sativa TaxID=4498 RepID=A0ACD5WDR9_AVESA
MNPLTQVKQTQLINKKEAALGLSENASWHARFKDSAYVYVGGISFDLTEGDLLAVFAQYGEVVDVNLVRDKTTGKSRGFAFLAYEDQRSTVLAVDNLNGAKVLGRIIKVDHVDKYKMKEEEDEAEVAKKREERGVCYAFQKGECNRGDACRFSHDEQRNANTGWGSKEDLEPKWEHDRHRGPSNRGGGVCYAFQKGECSRGTSCRFSHDEQRNANTGRGSREDSNARRQHDHDPPKSHKNFPDRIKEETRSGDREGQSSRSDVYRDRDSRTRHGDRDIKDRDRNVHERSPERSRGERQRGDDRYTQGREERSESKRSRHDRDSGGRYERRDDEEAERHRKSLR